MTIDINSSLLVIGGTNAGKTHYGGQLLRRLLKKKGALRMLSAPSDLTPFQEVLERLAQGRSASHTPAGSYRESIWEVGTEDETIRSQLIWPDYAGEQIENVVRLRQVPEPWVQRIKESNGWLFFIRLTTISALEDVLDRPRGRGNMQADSATTPTHDNQATDSSGQAPAVEITSSESLAASRVTISTQAGLIELLQALLFVKQVGTSIQLRQPALVVVLSCWDEIQDAKVGANWQDPTHLLKKRLPLLSQFIEATWKREVVTVVGLSSLGKTLQNDVGDDDFMDGGPERQGWCIGEGGVQNEDLTRPITALIERTAMHE